MSFLSGKGLLLLGLVVVLLIAIPVTIFVVQRQQQTQSKATPSTTLGFTPSTTETSPLQKNVGDTVTLDVTMNPGSNQVSRVQMYVNYDATKLTTTGADAGCGTALCPNQSVFPATIEGPTYKDGQAYIYLSIGADVTKALQQPDTKIATIAFKATNPTTTAPVKVSFDAQTQAGSILCDQLTGNCPDPLGENVISSLNPAFVKIGGAAVSPTPSPSVSVTPTVAPTAAPAAQAPTCTSLSVSSSTIVAGDTVTFTVAGTSPKPLTKVTYNFGDNSQQDVSQGGGIGTTTANAQIQHVYAAPGTYTANAILTNADNATSNPNTCKQTITVNAQPTVRPTMAPTGPASTLLFGISGVGVLLIVVGGILFFVL
jgi:plastocyanin